MPERIIETSGIEIWTESFGNGSDPTILLIMGPGPGILWPDELCEDLAAGGRQVIRYDHRNIGRSSVVDVRADPYTISNVAADAVGVLDAYGVDRGHLVGFSGGGAIAQVAVLEHPDRVASLTSWGATPLGTAAFQAAETLPGFQPQVAEAFARMFEPPADDEDRIERFIGLRRAFSGTLVPFDEDEARSAAKRAVAHTLRHEAVINHMIATADAPDRVEALSRVTVPTLVIHGTADAAIPLPHGEATAKAIPGAKLLTIEGLGHEYPRVVHGQIVPAILDHTAKAQEFVGSTTPDGGGGDH